LAELSSGIYIRYTFVFIIRPVHPVEKRSKHRNQAKKILLISPKSCTLIHMEKENPRHRLLKMIPYMNNAMKSFSKLLPVPNIHSPYKQRMFMKINISREQPEIFVDIFRLTEAKGAFYGVFSVYRIRENEPGRFSRFVDSVIRV
jgi:hypothetical protein